MKIKTNSQAVISGDTFIALKGETVDGHDYVDDAILRGAQKVIVEHGTYQVETVTVTNTKDYLLSYLDDTYGEGLSTLTLIGVTGTNGKTTSCYLMYQMLNKLGLACAYIGTIGFYLNDQVKELTMTTPNVVELYQMLNECKQAGVKYVVLEVSSHALKQERLGYLKFDYVVFTNLTKEHLDYHGSEEDYGLSKKKLFLKLKPKGKAIINIDDAWGKQMMVAPINITYGFNGSDYQLLSYKHQDLITRFKCLVQGETYEVKTKILGRYNLYNILTMMIVLHQVGISLSAIIKLVPLLNAPPGRMDLINVKEKGIIIDYAHTPDAVKNVLTAAREYTVGKVICLIGCGGGRDQGKRGLMGYYATKLADQVIFTSDNPRDEDPRAIIKDLETGAVHHNYEIKEDRKEAIRTGLKQLTPGDLLLILGKGHETYQIIGGEKMKHNDRDYVLEIIDEVK